jgi:hypothetical protein
MHKKKKSLVLRKNPKIIVCYPGRGTARKKPKIIVDEFPFIDRKELNFICQVIPKPAQDKIPVEICAIRRELPAEKIQPPQNHFKTQIFLVIQVLFVCLMLIICNR